VPPDAGAPTVERPRTAGATRPGAGRPRLRLVSRPALRVADVALFYGTRSGGIRTYLDAKATHAAHTGAFEHHLVVPGPRERHLGARHELRAVRATTSNGYRIPVGSRALRDTLLKIRPDVVLIHDPFWAPLEVARTAAEIGAKVVAVHHATTDLDAAALPGPDAIWRPLLRGCFRRAYGAVDAIMSVVDTFPDSGRPPTMPLRLGLDPAFRPQTTAERGDHVLYAGRLSREKGVDVLLEAAARSRDPWPLTIVGTGPLGDTLAGRARRLGIGQRVSFRPYVSDRRRLARLYAQASCVVMPGSHETFGLVALEAAASGARTVACHTAPSARTAAELCDTFAPGDSADLLEAIELARSRERDLEAAGELARRCAWAEVFAAELSDLEALVR
jgi:alpha-1,6-mannosyltransferase